MEERRRPTHRAGLFGYGKAQHTEPKSENGSTLPLLARMSRMDNPSFLLLADALPQIVWTAEPDGYQNYFNRQWFDYTGLTEQETYGGVSALHPDDFPRYVQQWSRAIQQGTYYEEEYRFRSKTGEYRWYLVRGLPVRDEHGVIVKWFGTCIDIHERHKHADESHEQCLGLEREVARRTAEIEILAERDRTHLQRLKTIIEFMPFAALACDECGVVLHKNRQFLTIFPFEEQGTLIGRDMSDVLEHMRPYLARPDRELMAIRGHLHAHTPFYDRELHLQHGIILSGDYIPLLEEGRYRGHLLLYRDVTQSKRSEAVKSEFVALASHQLRTPLTTIRWAINLLQQRCPPELAQFLDIASQAAHIMASTIATLLSITHMQSGQVQLSEKKVGVCQMLEEVREEVLWQEERSKRSIVIDCPKIIIQTDPDLLHEALQILVHNALNYSPQDSVVTLSGQATSTQVLLQVRDRGFGIPAAEQEKMFEKFFRGSNVMSKVPQGTGLGLYLCRLLVQALGGTVWFTSQEGQGTTFFIQLPVLRESSY